MTRHASYPRVALRSTRGYAPAPLRGKTATSPPISSRTRRSHKLAQMLLIRTPPGYYTWPDFLKEMP